MRLHEVNQADTTFWSSKLMQYSWLSINSDEISKYLKHQSIQESIKEEEWLIACPYSTISQSDAMFLRTPLATPTLSSHLRTMPQTYKGDIRGWAANLK